LNVTCDKCHRRALLPDEKIRATGVKFRCPGCGSVVTVKPPATGASRPFFILVAGAQQGPLDSGQLRQKVQEGQLGSRTYVWAEGMPDWKRAQDVPELAKILSPSAPSEDQLFSDQDWASETAPSTKQRKAKAEPEEDPFDQIAARSSSSSNEKFGEQTMFFIAKAGVNKRNPPWKIALFVILLVGLPAGALYGLSALRVVPLEYTQLDEDGQEVKTQVFSLKGVTGLGDLLLGRTPQRTSGKNRGASQNGRGKSRETVPSLAGQGTGGADLPGDEGARTGTGPTADLTGAPTSSGGALEAFYADGQKKDLAPSLRRQGQPLAPAARTGEGGPSGEDIQRAISQSQPAFQLCIEEELKKNPSFRGGKIQLIATIARSGTVTRTAIEPPAINDSRLGSCLKTRALRMGFSPFAGEEVDLEIPLLLGRTL
jgi:predicted Zn finger-like uncharacterized protein